MLSQAHYVLRRKQHDIIHEEIGDDDSNVTIFYVHTRIWTRKHQIIQLVKLISLLRSDKPLVKSQEFQ